MDNIYSWEKNVRKVIPYIAGEQPKKDKMIKLNTNECPYPPSKTVLKVLEKYSKNADKLRLYPDTMSEELVSELSKFLDVDKDMIFPGVGSDDVIANCFLTFFNSEKPILFPEITYSFYPVWADLYKIPFKKIPLMDDFSINTEDYFGENGGIIIPNPNAPTSVFEKLEKIEEILKNNKDSVVIIDEAYIDFGGDTAIHLTKKYDNLLVVQTFSKSRSLAGLRIGYAVGNKKLISYLNDVKNSINSYTLSTLAIEIGAQSVRDVDYFNEISKKIIDTREKVKKELKELSFEFPDSKANFIFAKNDKIDIIKLYNYLREKDIYVRHWNQPLIKDYVRISIGTDDEMKVFIDEVKEFMNKESLDIK
jgi:histidinol-phosphate aminotransferase